MLQMGPGTVINNYWDEVFVISRIITIEVGVISRNSRLRLIPGGGTLGISGWGCAAGTIEPRASSAEFCYPILELTPQITLNLD